MPRVGRMGQDRGNKSVWWVGCGSNKEQMKEWGDGRMGAGAILGNKKNITQ